MLMIQFKFSHSVFTCSKSAIQILAQCVIYSKKTIKTAQPRKWHRPGAFTVNWSFHMFYS